jgi:septum formation protein
MKETAPAIVLASASPRRAELLANMGLRFQVVPPNVRESIDPEAAPEAEACRWAVAKAEEVAARVAPAIIIGADTVCALGGEIIGKPRNRAHAVDILRRLSGTRHRVLTGLCVLDSGSGVRVVDFVSTAVTMRPMTDEQIRAYVAGGEADDKAGAYAIQETGDRYVARFEGSFDNVVGLPTERLRDILNELGISCV